MVRDVWNKHKPKFYLLIVCLVLVAIGSSFYSEPLDPPANLEPKSEPIPNRAPGQPKSPLKSSASVPANTPSAQSTQVMPGNTSKTVKHVDMLSPEMRQALRDKLIHHGPKTVIYHDNGMISLPANGRFTQMPVAVEMPDGTIKIQEYSVLPNKP